VRVRGGMALVPLGRASGIGFGSAAQLPCEVLTLRLKDALWALSFEDECTSNLRLGPSVPGAKRSSTNAQIEIASASAVRTTERVQERPAGRRIETELTVNPRASALRDAGR
jgi:hypothetical protein